MGQPAKFSREEGSAPARQRIWGNEIVAGHARERDGPGSAAVQRSRAGEAKPSYLGHVLTENRNGLIVKACVTESSTRAEREAGLEMLRGMSRKEESGKVKPITLGGDKAYQEEAFIGELRTMRVIPHIAEYERHRPSWLTSGEQNDPGYAISQRKRKLVENF